jgi:transposase
MRFDTNQHPLYCGIDLHARTLYVCILRQDGEVVLHRNMPARPDTLLKAIAPSRDGIVIAVACLFTWYGLADLCAQERLPFVVGHALSMQAIHGGKATNDTIDSQKIAVRLRGGMLPQASGSPAALRATRDLLRRRGHLTRKRAALLAHIQTTHRQYTLPEIGKKIADKANREGVAERFPDPAVHTSVAIDLALLDFYDPLLRDVAWTLVQTATPHNAQTLDRLQAVPGIGTILSLVLLYESHAIPRFPRVQDGVSSCRLVKWAKASAGKRSGTSGATSGPSSRTWACSEAAVLFLRHHPAGQQDLARLENKQGQGNALTVFAHPLARAVSYRLQRDTAFDMHQLLTGERSAVSEPAAALALHGRCLRIMLWKTLPLRRCTRRSMEAWYPCALGG